MSLQKDDFNQNLIYKHSTLLRYNLQLFANDEGGEKTEDATPKKLKEAREEGQVAKSTELNTAVMLFALFLVLKIYIGSIGNQFIDVYEKIYGSITLVVEDDMSMNIIMSLLGYSIKTIILIALPIFLVGVVVGFLVDKVQIKWKVTTKPLKPKLSKLDPIKGFKKMFSKEKLVQLLFSLLKIILIGVLVYDTLKD